MVEEMNRACSHLELSCPSSLRNPRGCGGRPLPMSITCGHSATPLLAVHMAGHGVGAWLVGQGKPLALQGGDQREGGVSIRGFTECLPCARHCSRCWGTSSEQKRQEVLPLVERQANKPVKHQMCQISVNAMNKI